MAHYVDAMIAGTPVDVIAEFYPAMAGLDHTGSLEPLRDDPDLVLTGDKDKMIPKEHSELIVELAARRRVRRRPRRRPHGAAREARRGERGPHRAAAPGATALGRAGWPR